MSGWDPESLYVLQTSMWKDTWTEMKPSKDEPEPARTNWSLHFFQSTSNLHDTRTCTRRLVFCHQAAHTCASDSEMQKRKACQDLTALPAGCILCSRGRRACSPRQPSEHWNSCCFRSRAYSSCDQLTPHPSGNDILECRAWRGQSGADTVDWHWPSTTNRFSNIDGGV